VAGVFVSEKKIVATTERDTAQRSLGDVVVGRDRREAQETPELTEILQQIADGSTHCRARREGSAMPAGPTQEPGKQWPRPLFAQLQVGLGPDDSCLFGLGFDPIDVADQIQCLGGFEIFALLEELASRVVPGSRRAAYAQASSLRCSQ
jgi:hypothetical protein